MHGEQLAAGMLVLLAIAHSVLGETSLLRPLFKQEWDIDEPRWGVERVFRFAWHLTSMAWLALAAVLLDIGVLSAVAVLSMASAALVFVMLRGHLAWPMFLLAAFGALQADGRLTETVREGGALAAVVMLTLAALVHVYWAFGGRWMLDVAVPVDPTGQGRRPGPILTFAVALALVVFAGLVIAAVADVGPSIVGVLVWIGVAVFAVRAIGDTKTVGFSKSDHSSPFAQADDRWFTPIVFSIALGATASVLG